MDCLVGQESRRRRSVPRRDYEATGSGEGGHHDLEPEQIRSDWVRAEAGRAKEDGKLIPVKTPELTYADIPLPFGEMHTESVSSTDLIRAAIVGHLAKPSAAPSPFWQIKSTFKYQVLTWIGIVGSAITLFANLKGVLDLADWAREIVAHWQEIDVCSTTTTFTRWLASARNAASISSGRLASAAAISTCSALAATLSSCA